MAGNAKDEQNRHDRIPEPRPHATLLKEHPSPAIGLRRWKTNRRRGILRRQPSAAGNIIRRMKCLLPAGARGLLCVLPLLWIVDAAASPGQERPARPIANVLVVTLDGLRWQEVFAGMSNDLLTPKEGGISEAAPMERRFGGATLEERREKLMPWF